MAEKVIAYLKKEADKEVIKKEKAELYLKDSIHIESCYRSKRHGNHSKRF